MGKTIFVLIDACRYDLGSIYLSALEHRIDYGLGAKYKVTGELPSLSRPMYETLMTGLPMYRHGIGNNNVCRRSYCESVFSLAKEHGLTTGAAAYYWMSELYCHAPFNKQKDRIQTEPGDKSLIDHGIYYWDDLYPDSHLYADGEWIRNVYRPDFMMYHSMGVDEMGHLHGSESVEYTAAIGGVNDILADLLPVWLEEGYNVVVTADHGMSVQGIHGGNSRDQREVPLYLFGENVITGRFEDHCISQRNIAPLLCRLLHIPSGKEMMTELEIKLEV